MNKHLSIILILVCVLNSCTKKPDSNPTPTGDGPYFPQVKQIIASNCLSCHSPGGMGMPTLLNSDENIVNTAAQIKAATTDPVTPNNKRMPQGGELTSSEKQIILNWFNKGGKRTD